MSDPPSRSSPAARAIAEQLAGELAHVGGVEAVVVGGSQASGLADARSDLDLGIYYEPEHPLDLSALRALAVSLGCESGAVTAPGEWGHWVNGGAWLQVEGMKVDWIYRDLERVDAVIEDCLRGHLSCDYTLGHPHGFHNHFYLAELHYCDPVYDPDRVVEGLKERVDPYPAVLRQAIVEKYLYDAGFMLNLGAKRSYRADVLHAAGCLFRGAAALVQVAFALEERYLMNEKGALEATASFARVPEQFAERTSAVLARPGATAKELSASFDALEALRDEMREISPPLSYEWTSTRSV